jgi:class 3 adenylate cyclase/tetratricopeptide (TPR) repeat protein
MSRCLACGAENTGGSRFCSSCGNPLTADPAQERRKLVTLVFCDLSGSTSLGEHLDPESVRDMMFRYFHTVRSAIELHGGAVEKFVGDAVLAVFGVPVAHEDDALRALRAAAEMRDRLERLNEELGRRFGRQIALRIGVNTGVVVVGDPASDETFVTGDAVNVAARLQQAAGENEILLGERTHVLAGGAATVEQLEPLSLKGKSEPLPAYRLLGVSPGASVRVPRLDRPIVDRKPELAALLELLDASVEGSCCQLVTVVGEPGVGKSRLVAELEASVSDRATVLSGRCLAYGEGITFWPLAELVREAAGIRDGLPVEEAVGRLERLAGAEVAGPVAAAIGLSGETGDRDTIVWAFRRLFEELAAERPLVAHIEDLHWAEPTLLELITHLRDRAARPILLVCTARPELLEATPEWEATVRLEPLQLDEVGELIDDFALGGVARAKILEASGGNPLFAEELAHLLREHPGERAIPTTLSALLTARLDRLPEAERRIAERASVEGLVFHRGAVLELSPANERPAVQDAIAELVSRDLVQPAKADFADEAAFRFRHGLIRDAAHSGLPKRVRAELHERFAAWLQLRASQSGRDQEEIVGYHLEQTVRYRAELGLLDERELELARQASGLLAVAGRRALARGDAPAAVNLLERAVSLLADEDTERPALRLDLGEALREAGELARADETLREVIEQADALGDKPLGARGRLERAFLQRYFDREARVDDLLRVAEQAALVFEEHGDDAGLSRSLRLAGEAHWSHCRIGAMAEAYERALAHARRRGDHRELAGIYQGLVRSTFAGPMPAEAAIVHCEEILRQAPPDRTLEAMIAGVVGLLEAMRGRFPEARVSAAHAISLFEELGKPVVAAAVRGWAGAIELYAGAPEDAETLLRPAFETLEARGETGNLSTVAAYLAEALYAQGRVEEAEQATETSERCAAVDDIHAQVGWRITRARVMASRGETDAAEALAHEAGALAAETDYLNLQGDALAVLGEVALAARRADGADALARALEVYSVKGNVVAVASVRAALDGASAAASAG